MKNLLFILIFVVLSTNNKAQTVTDIDGNIYNTVIIGSQKWMKENLKTTKYKDGGYFKDIPWFGVAKYGWYNNDSVIYKGIYGNQYNYAALVPYEMLCPQYWHVPYTKDWNTLIDYLGGNKAARGKLKEAGTNHWLIPDTAANNSSGFTALPGGYNNSELGIAAYFRADEHIPTPGMIPVGPGVKYSAYVKIDNDTILSARKDNGGYWISDFALVPVRCVCDTIYEIPKVIVPDPPTVEKLEIFPNPATEKLNMKNMKFNDYTIYIYDFQGQLVFEHQNVTNTIDISNFTKGLYFMKVENLGKVMIAKFIKI